MTLLGPDDFTILENDEEVILIPKGKLQGVSHTVEVERVIEQMAFGEPVTKEIKKHIKCYLVKSGSNPTTPETQELTQDVLTMLRNARKAKIDNKLGGSPNGGMQEGVFGSSPVQNPTPATNNGGFTNPFI